MKHQLEEMNLTELRELAKEHGIATGGNRAQIIARITRASQQNDSGVKPITSDGENKAASDAAELDQNDSTTLDDAVQPNQGENSATPAAPSGAARYRYTPVSGQHLVLGKLLVPGTGAVFDEPNPEYEGFVPYYLTRTVE